MAKAQPDLLHCIAFHCIDDQFYGSAIIALLAFHTLRRVFWLFQFGCMQFSIFVLLYVCLSIAVFFLSVVSSSLAHFFPSLYKKNVSHGTLRQLANSKLALKLCELCLFAMQKFCLCFFFINHKNSMVFAFFFIPLRSTIWMFGTSINFIMIAFHDICII